MANVESIIYFIQPQYGQDIVPIYCLYIYIYIPCVM